MKKIFILVDQLHSHGGIEKLVTIKANYWSEILGYKVTILSTEQEERQIVYKLSDKVEHHDLRINYIRAKSYFSFKNVLKLIRNIVQIQKYVFKENPDFVLVASHIPITYLTPFLFGKAKTIKEFHFTKYNRNNKEFKNKILTYIESKYDFLVVLSEEERTFYFSKNTVVIPNPIEKIDCKIDYSQNKNKAMAIGRFAPVKQFEKMIEIWSRFVTINPSWKLHFFGEIGNQYFKKIEQLVIEKNLKEFVVFEGQSDNVHSELAKAKLLLLTSEQECFPMVILEANAMGVPVISFDSPTGPRNIMHHYHDGILVKYDDCDAFVKELITFDSTIAFQNQLSKNAIENAKKYNIETIMNQWNNLIFKKND